MVYATTEALNKILKCEVKEDRYKRPYIVGSQSYEMTGLANPQRGEGAEVAKDSRKGPERQRASLQGDGSIFRIK